MISRLLIALILCLCADSGALARSRIKDITSVQGIRDNQLVGYGLVIGLAGTGDGLKNSPFTEISMQSMLQKLGVKLEPGSIGSKNVAAVVVTATLPPFVAEGSRIDVSVSSLGDATSLKGGVLVMTPLLAADGSPYAVAQGAVAAGGFQAAGQAATVTQGVPTTGRIPNGAIVEKNNTAEINLLSVAFQSPNKSISALDKLSFNLTPGETLVLLGESGCGKSLTSLALMRLLPKQGVYRWRDVGGFGLGGRISGDCRHRLYGHGIYPD